MLVMWLPDISRWNSGMVLPDSLTGALPQFFIFGLDTSRIRLLPTAWSLAIELYFYIVIGLVTAPWKYWTAILAIAAVALSLLCATHIAPWDFYGSVAGNADAFFMGSLVWHCRNRGHLRNRATIFAAFAIFLILAFGPPIGRITVNIFLAAPAAAFCIWEMQQYSMPAGVHAARLCDFLGRLTYPLFLIHTPMAALIGEAQGWSMGTPLFAAALAASLIFSALAILLVERPVEHLRNRIRGRNSSGPEATPP
jgi:peptidoglycan/LPS O-acetylase OafA/YrhL